VADQPKKTVKSAKAKPEIKKVRAYPFAATIDFKGIKKPVQIMKLAAVGAWTDLGTTVVQVGVTYNLDFEFPVSHEQVSTPARVMRTMDRVQEKDGGKAVERLAEFQFVKPSAETLEKVRKFLATINQHD
jgi:hypothetical protein